MVLFRAGLTKLVDFEAIKTKSSSIVDDSIGINYITIQ